MLSTIVKLNGIYDILCAACIARYISIPLFNKLHISVFNYVLSKKERNYLAGWVCLNGLVRLTNFRQWIILSYIVEACVFIGALFLQRVYLWKAFFIIVTSLLLSYLLL
jgi:hypothetical protein